MAWYINIYVYIFKYDTKNEYDDKTIKFQII